jgi:hypothetical protein
MSDCIFCKRSIHPEFLYCDTCAALVEGIASRRVRDALAAHADCICNDTAGIVQVDGKVVSIGLTNEAGGVFERREDVLSEAVQRVNDLHDDPDWWRVPDDAILDVIAAIKGDLA